MEGSLPQHVHFTLRDQAAACQNRQQSGLPGPVQPDQDTSAPLMERQLVQPQGDRGPLCVSEGQVLNSDRRSAWIQIPLDTRGGKFWQRRCCGVRRRCRNPADSHVKEATDSFPRIASFRGGCITAHDLPLMHVEHVRCPRIQPIEDVRDSHDGASILLQEVKEPLAHKQVQVGGRLVQEQHCARIPQLATQLNSPALPVRDAAHVPPKQPAQPKHLEEAGGAGILRKRRHVRRRRLARGGLLQSEHLPHSHEVGPLSDPVPCGAQDPLDQGYAPSRRSAEGIHAHHLDTACGCHLLS
mmetsp:Transcript_68738/g.201265  ORF Transcript_68738/g.201265 Transcript_68738/m.201265 type:complete len:298 (-) Transcript_68738:235-1128(-)